MKAAIALVLVFALSGAPAQELPPPAPDADLETIRDWAASRMISQASGFKDMLQRALPMLQSSLGDETTAIRETIARLATRAALHPAVVLDAMRAATSPVLRRRLAEVFVATRDPSIGPVLIGGMAGADEEMSGALVSAIGRLQAREVAPELLSRMNATESPALLGELVVALARLEAKEALPAARKLLDHQDPRARESGAAALGLVGSGKEDIEALRKLASGPEPALRAAAIRALGRFKGDLDALRVLHEAVASADPLQVRAALDALEQAGTKELTPHFVLQVVKTGPLELRERAAKILLRFGNVEGVRIVVQPEKSEADKNPGNRTAQVAAGDRCRELGWYEGAIPYYDRALSGRSGDVSDQQVLVALARCYARLKRFDDAKRKLRAAHYTSFRSFADDPDFQEMKESPAFREAFK
jgi:HEAT repeat protein